jgi:carbon storage regulator CsrA
VLIFKRTNGERVRIGEAEVMVIETHRGWVKLGVQAPRSIVVERGELAAATPAPARPPHTPTRKPPA